MQTSKTEKQTLDHLNSLLRGEISAVETYKQALGKLEETYRPVLEDCAHSHEIRAKLLEEEVRRRGGKPARTSGAWGSFAKIVEGTAAKLGNKAAIAALEEGEDHGRNDYYRELDTIETSAREFILMNLLPEQSRTHDAISGLKKSLS